MGFMLKKQGWIGVSAPFFKQSSRQWGNDECPMPKTERSEMSRPTFS